MLAGGEFPILLSGVVGEFLDVRVRHSARAITRLAGEIATCGYRGQEEEKIKRTVLIHRINLK